jgi:hypothetical protein
MIPVPKKNQVPDLALTPGSGDDYYFLECLEMIKGQADGTNHEFIFKIVKATVTINMDAASELYIL